MKSDTETNLERNNPDDETLMPDAMHLMINGDIGGVDASPPASPLLNFDDADDSTANPPSGLLKNQDTLDLFKGLQSVTIATADLQAKDKQASYENSDVELKPADSFVPIETTNQATEIPLSSCLRAASTESARSTTEREVSRITSDPLELGRISPVPLALPDSAGTDKNNITPSHDSVPHYALTRIPANPFAQSAARFAALRRQLNELLTDAEFRDRAPVSAVRALHDLKTRWTAQARQLANHSRTTQSDLDVLKRESLQSLTQVKRALAAQGNLWHRYVRPLLNALISWITYVESCLGVPDRFHPRLFKPTYAEEAVQHLQLEDELMDVHDAYARDLSAMAPVMV